MTRWFPIVAAVLLTGCAGYAQQLRTVQKQVHAEKVVTMGTMLDIACAGLLVTDVRDAFRARPNLRARRRPSPSKLRSSIPALLLLPSSRASPALTWHMVTAPDLREQAVRAGLPADVRAFAPKAPGSCTIHSPPSKTWEERVELWFHELRHCDEGARH